MLSYFVSCVLLFVVMFSILELCLYFFCFFFFSRRKPAAEFSACLVGWEMFKRDSYISAPDPDKDVCFSFWRGGGAEAEGSPQGVCIKAVS